MKLFCFVFSFGLRADHHSECSICLFARFFFFSFFHLIFSPRPSLNLSVSCFALIFLHFASFCLRIQANAYFERKPFILFGHYFFFFSFFWTFAGPSQLVVTRQLNWFQLHHAFLWKLKRFYPNLGILYRYSREPALNFHLENLILEFFRRNDGLIMRFSLDNASVRSGLLFLGQWKLGKQSTFLIIITGFRRFFPSICFRLISNVVSNIYLSFTQPPSHRALVAEFPIFLLFFSIFRVFLFPPQSFFLYFLANG